MRCSTRFLAAVGLTLLVSGPLYPAPPKPGQTFVRRSPARRLVADRPAGATSLKALNDCDALRGYVTDVVVETLVRRLYWSYAVLAYGGAMRDGEGAGSPTDYTTTNVQEQGVDELDLVETDGEYVYATVDDLFAVVDSWPPQESRLASSVRLEGTAHGLFLRGDLAAVFSTYWNSGGFAPQFWGGTRLQIIDVSDRSAPAAVRTIDVEGSLVAARMIDGHLYAVVSTWMPIPEAAWRLLDRDDLGLPELDDDPTDEEREAAAAIARAILRPHVRETVVALALGDLVPEVRDRTQADPEPDPQPLLGCGDLFRPPEISQYSVLSVLHLDLDRPDPVAAPLQATGLLADGWTVYASARNLYVAQSSWWWWRGWGPPDMTTAIHKLELAGDSDRPVRYKASGEVDGWLLNQFSLSEHDSHLRSATTEFDWWWGTSEDGEDRGSLVTVLEDDGRGRLVQVGRIEGIAPGERIYACRFMGDRGYLVTFVQVDPLFTVDLSDPTRPAIVGELEVPGFSSYLHPIGEDHLLAVGIDADEQGRPIGLAVSVFDVRDFARPKLAHRHLIEDQGGVWSWSEALDDHHAFTYHRDVLSIPAYISGEGGSFSGLVVLWVDPTLGISELGRVDHADLPPGPWSDSPWMRRSVYIEDALYSLSTLGVKANLLYQPTVELARVPFYGRVDSP